MNTSEFSALSHPYHCADVKPSASLEVAGKTEKAEDLAHSPKNASKKKSGSGLFGLRYLKKKDLEKKGSPPKLSRRTGTAHKKQPKTKFDNSLKNFMWLTQSVPEVVTACMHGAIVAIP